MSVTRIDTHKDSVLYATPWLEVVPEIKDKEALASEMTAEWLNLTHAFIEFSKPIKRPA
jgi:hypothetical protein